jgi:hypothetical protein
MVHTELVNANKKESTTAVSTQGTSERKRSKRQRRVGVTMT